MTKSLQVQGKVPYTGWKACVFVRQLHLCGRVVLRLWLHLKLPAPWLAVGWLAPPRMQAWLVCWLCV